MMSDEVSDFVFKKIDDMKILNSEMPADKAAMQKADAILGTIGVGKPMSERDIKTLVQKLDREIDWMNMGQATANDFLKSVRRELDGVIKGNDAYKAQNEKVKQLANSLDLMESKFGFKPQGGSYATTDTTSSKIKNLFDAQGNAKKPETVAGLNAIDPKIADEIRMRQILDRTEGGVTSGSRNTLMGGGTGIAVGSALAPILGPVAPAVGAAVGGAAGYVKDKYGRKIGKELIDKNRDTILNRDEFFQKMGEKVGAIGQKVSTPNTARTAVQSGFTAAIVPSFIANELSKDMSKLDDNEKRAITKIYLLKQNNPNLSENDAKEIMAKTIPGYQRKQAADQFLED
jgi:hypothetical protein